MHASDMVASQRAAFKENGLAGPQFVSPQYFLPKDREGALRAIAEMLLVIKNTTLLDDAEMDFEYFRKMICANDEITELIDLIERS